MVANVTCPVEVVSTGEVCGKPVTNGVTCGRHGGHVTGVCADAIHHDSKGWRMDPKSYGHNHCRGTGVDGITDRRCVCPCHEGTR